MFLTIINFKTYPEATAEHARTLTQACQQVSDNSNFNIMLAPQAIDMKEVSDNTDLFIVAQHADYQEPGQSTGFQIPETLKLAGASAVMLNHSEHKLSMEVLDKTVERVKDTGMLVILCASTVSEAKDLEEFMPDYIAFEPEGFIGSEVSVVDGDASEIADVIDAVNAPVIIGAGIKSKHDVKVCHDLGAAGVLMASHVVKSKEPVTFLNNLLSDLHNQ
jgi:triosephosphate isomerase